jgi:hypothetical protein
MVYNIEAAEATGREVVRLWSAGGEEGRKGGMTVTKAGRREAQRGWESLYT